MPAPIENGGGEILKMEEFLLFNATWPWPWHWIGPHGTSSCITRRPIPTHRTDFEAGFIGSTRSRPKIDKPVCKQQTCTTAFNIYYLNTYKWMLPEWCHSSYITLIVSATISIHHFSRSRRICVRHIRTSTLWQDQNAQLAPQTNDVIRAAGHFILHCDSIKHKRRLFVITLANVDRF